MSATLFKIAVLRDKAVARHSVERAVRILMSAGMVLRNAARYVFSVLRAQRQGGAA